VLRYIVGLQDDRRYALTPKALKTDANIKQIMPNAMKIVLDTNFLMIPGQLGLDIFSELERICDFSYKVFIVEETIKELEKIAEKAKTSDKKAVRIAKELIKTKKIGIIPAKEGYVDDLLVELSKSEDIIVATNDTELKKRLKRAIILKQKKYLSMI